MEPETRLQFLDFVASKGTKKKKNTTKHRKYIIITIINEKGTL